MNAKNANAILESANRAIEYILQRDIAAGYGTNEDPAPKWIQAVSQINKEMVSVKPAVPDATEIPQLLVAVDAFWPKNHDWPDWESICNPDVAMLEKHEWWPKAIGVKGNGVEGQFSKSVLGKRKAAEVTVEEGKAEQEEDAMEIDEDAQAEACRKEKIDGKKKVQDDNPHNNSEDIEHGQPTRRRRIHDDNKNLKRLDNAKEGAAWKNDMQRKKKAPDNSVNGSNENSEYATDSQIDSITSQVYFSDTQQVLPAGGRRRHCMPALQDRQASLRLFQQLQATPAPSKPPSPSPVAHTKEQSQSGLSSKKLIPEVVITSKPIKKPVPSRKQRPSPPPVAGPSCNHNKSVNCSSPIHPRSVPPATAATNSTARALTPGRAYSLNGVPMATKEELDVLKEELHSFWQKLAQMRDERDKGVKALL
ncbi:hypothetical protein JVU11DRAFT_11136 [Chiua virens]|nr:hypothetical protein JVU11DRAFT_11136 [Chiua virens]